MSSREIRRHRRIAFSATVNVSWDEGAGPRFARGKCIDLSETGLRIELPVSIPLRTRVQLTTDRVGVAGSATIRSADRLGGKNVIGLELTGTLPEKIRDSLRDPVPDPPVSV